MTDRPIIIFGASEIARVAHQYFVYSSTRKVAAFVVDEAYIDADKMLDLPVVSTTDASRLFPPDEYDAFVAIGSNQLNYLRQRFFDTAKKLGYHLASFVHPSTQIWRNATIGENCFILENNVIQPDVEIGNNVTLWTFNSIGHGSKIGDHVFITAHVTISGLCTVGNNSFFGVNTAVAENLEIGRDNYITMASAVTKSTPADRILQGNPAIERKVSARQFARVKDYS